MVHGFCSTISSFYPKPMKKVLFLLTFLLFSVQIQAQDLTLLNRIKTVSNEEFLMSLDK